MHQLGPIHAPRFDEVIDIIDPGDSSAEQLLEGIAWDLNSQVARFDGADTTTPRLAWLHLFTRNWNVVETALMLGRRMAPQIGEALRRLEFELLLDLSLIQDEDAPLRLFAQAPDDQPRSRSVERALAAYLTWCIKQDLDYHRRIRQKGNLDELFNPAVEGQIASSPAMSAILEAFWGPGHTAPTADETRERRRNARDNAHRSVNTLLDLLEGDSDLSYWHDLTQPTGVGRASSFAELLDPELRSVSKLTRKTLGQAHAVDYQWTSAAIHGKSLESLVVCSSEGVIPYWTYAGPDEVEGGLEGIGRIAHMNKVRLEVLAQDVLS